MIYSNYRKLYEEDSSQEDKIKRFGAEYVLDLSLKELVKKIKYWFETNLISDYELVTIELNSNLGSGNANSIMIEITDGSVMWRLKILTRVEDLFVNKGLKSFDLEMKCYNKDVELLVTNLETGVKITDFDEKYIINMLNDSELQVDKYDTSNLKDRPESDEEVEGVEDLKDDVY